MFTSISRIETLTLMFMDCVDMFRETVKFIGIGLDMISFQRPKFLIWNQNRLIEEDILTGVLSKGSNGIRYRSLAERQLTKREEGNVGGARNWRREATPLKENQMQVMASLVARLIHWNYTSKTYLKELGSFENSYIPENPRTPKPLTFSKNRLRAAKNRSNTSSDVKKNSEKTIFVFKNFCFKNGQIPEFFYRSLYNTYLKANFINYERFGGLRSRFFERNNGLGDIENWGSSRSRYFENSYIPENPRTLKPLTFSKNRLRGAKNRSNISPVAKFFFRKNDFFFPKTLHMCKRFLCAYVHSFLFCFKTAQKHEMSLYNTYLKRFRIVMIKNVLEGSEVGFLKGITIAKVNIIDFDKEKFSIYERTQTPLINIEELQEKDVVLRSLEIEWE
ncbi:hypothetical protein LXL04_008046 [Taraxacum kok-saghyz]